MASKAESQGRSLAALNKRGLQWHPLFGATLASYAVQWSNPQRPLPNISDFLDLYHHVGEYITLDPIVFDEAANAAFQKNYDTVLLRLAGQQFRYFRGGIFNLARAKLLWDDAAKLARQRRNFPKVDLDKYFSHVVGANLDDMLGVAMVALASVDGENSSFNRQRFITARNETPLRLPEDRTLQQILGFLAADRDEFRELAATNKLLDRRYRIYDFNPLHMKPLIRSLRGANRRAEEDVFLAPIPNLLASRISDGVYYEAVFEQRVDILRAFGFVFEEYIGIILRASGLERKILTEQDIRSRGYGGKAPDFVVVEGDTITLLECKSCRMPVNRLGRDSTDDYFAMGLRQVHKALKQLREFIYAVRQGKVKGLEGVKNIVPTVITFEPLYLLNNSPFHDKLADLWPTDLPDWNCLSVVDVEEMQPHVQHSIPLHDAVLTYRKLGTFEASNHLQARTSVPYSESYLAQVHGKLGQQLGVDQLRDQSVMA